MDWIDAYPLTDHPARDRWFWLAREENPDTGQRDAARATLVRLALTGETHSPPPSAEALVVLAAVLKRPCCNG